MMLRPLCVLILAVGLLGTCSAKTIYVDGTNGNDSWTGLCSDWDGDKCGPKKSISAAITASASGDEIAVANGTYRGASNRNLNFKGKAITLRSANGAANCIIDCERGSRGFVFATNETSSAILAGFTIANGRSISGGEDQYGAGIYMKNASPTVRDCVIVNCLGYSNGGGIYISGGKPTIERCSIELCVVQLDNSTGGGIYCSAAATITNCVLSANYAYSGGGLSLLNSGASVQDCRIADNSALRGGGVYTRAGANPLQRCDITGNRSNTSGGGVYLDGASSAISNCTIAGNNAYETGGGVSGNGKVLDCVIESNVANFGGGVAGAGALNCIIVGNNAKSSGGAFYSENQSPTWINCTVVGNVAATGGGGAYTVGGSPNLVNCILWSDFAPQGAELALVSSSKLSVSYCDVAGGKDGAYIESGSTLKWGSGNLAHDPGLTGRRARVTAGSVCIDGGDPARDYSGQWDIDAEERVSGAHVDIGADEFSDSDSDGMPDVWEQEYFGSPEGGDPAADDDSDGVTNLDEYLADRNPVRAPSIFYADPTGNDDWDGRAPSWDGEHGPKATIQAAINLCGFEERDIVELADGVYKGPGNIEVDFGGRGATLRSANGPENCIIDCESKSRAFLLRHNEPPATTLSGLWIRKSKSVSGIDGGAIVCAGSYLSAENCNISDSTSDQGGCGGITLYNARASLRHCSLKNITVNGAVFAENGQLTVEDCTFDACTGTYVAGGIDASETDVRLINCTFQNNLNSAVDVFGGRLESDDCTFSNNLGGIAANGGSHPDLQCEIRRCRFDGGAGTKLAFTSLVRIGIEDTEFHGGSAAILGDAQDIAVARCTITDCTGLGARLTGSQTVDVSQCIVRNNGAPGLELHGSARVLGCVITGNAEDYDIGGIQIESGLIAGCTIIGNRLANHNDVLQGNGVTVNGTCELRNCLIADNSGATRNELAVNANGNATVSHCEVAGGKTGVVNKGRLNWLDGNIDADPLLARTGDHLLAASPLRDAGDVRGSGDVDIDGESPSTDGKPDIGADEFVDADADGLPDWWELQYFGSPTAGEANGDDDDDQRINLDEYSLSTDPLTPSRVYYVDPSGNDGWDGRAPQWDGASGPKATIQAAIDAADGEQVDTVQAADGVYKGVGNRALDPRGKSITVRSANGPDKCTIDCESAAQAFTIAHGEDRFCMIDGFTIKHGDGVYGGGIYMRGASPTISNCVFDSNRTHDLYAAGAGLYSRNGSPRLSNCAFTGNLADAGSGYYRGQGGGAYFTFGEVEIVRCRFEKNKVGRLGAGAGLYLYGVRSTVDNCDFVENSDQNGGASGGGIYSDYGQATIRVSRFSGNVIGGKGAGIYCSAGDIVDCELTENTNTGDWTDSAGGAIYAGKVQIVNCLVSDNELQPSSGSVTGGGISAGSGSVISNCRILRNSSAYSAGGVNGDRCVIRDCLIEGNSARRTGGGLLLSSSTIENCVVRNNSAAGQDGAEGGGITCSGTDMRIVGCDIRSNSARGSATAFGGGIRLNTTSGTIVNCTIAGNLVDAVDGHGGGIDQRGSACDVLNTIVLANHATHGAQIADEGSGSLKVSFSAIRRDEDDIFDPSNEIVWSDGNITDDPQLAFPPNDIHVTIHSPCIDSGTDDLPFQLPDRDIDGTQRVLDGDGDGTSRVDMGAFEFDRAAPRLAVSSPDLDFWAFRGDSDPVPQSLGIRNAGGNVLHWHVEGDGATWLNFGPTDGDATDEIELIELRASVSNLDAGDYSSVLTVTADRAAGSPQTVTVELHVRTVRHVPADYQTIQDALDACATEGDVVLVDEGLYAGSGNRNLNFKGKAIALRATGSVAKTVIDAGSAARGFVFETSETNAAVVDGFTIIGGTGQYGGGVFCDSGCSPSILNCAIERCQATAAGGGVFVSSGNPIIRDCRIQDNTAALNGGGIYSTTLTATIERCFVARNSAQYGGGAAGRVNPVDCTFIENTATGSSGEIDGGGGLHLDTSSTVQRCTFRGNVAKRSGGGILLYSQYADAHILNCVFVGNTSAEGGGALAAASSARGAIVNCSMSANKGGKQGGAMYCVSKSRLQIVNDILVGDSATNGAELAVSGTSSTLTTSYSDVKGGADGVYVTSSGKSTWGTNNLDVDPGFLLSDDLHLAVGSACIDVGSNSAVDDMAETSDGDGGPRLTDGNGDGVAIVDLGAYEYGEDTLLIECSPPNLRVSVFEDLPPPTNQTLTLHRVGTRDLPWRIKSDWDWISVIPSNGILGDDFMNCALCLDTSNVKAGIYDCSLTIIADDASNSPLVIPMTIQVVATRRVPSEYSAIRDAVSAAKNGELVLVADGTYSGTKNRGIAVTGKAITIRSENGPANCTIDCESLDRAFAFSSGVSTPPIVEGFTILRGAGSGGAIQCNKVHAVIRNCIVRESASTDYGGAIYALSSNMQIVNCLFDANTADRRGGALYFEKGSPLIQGCTIAANSVTKSDGIGGAVCATLGAKATIANSVLWSNSAANGNQLAGTDSGTTLTVRYSDVQDGESGVFLSGGATLTWGTGSFDADPVFVDPGQFDFHLSNGSPCVNAGDPNYDGATERDIDEEFRILDGRMEVGADEVAVVPLKLGDLDCDGTVGFGDIDAFVLALIDPDEYAAQFPACDVRLGDINGDGAVDFNDIDPFVACLVNGGCP